MNGTIAGQLFIFALIGACLVLAALHLSGQMDALAAARDFVQVS